MHFAGCRPGLLDREAKARGLETFFSKMLSSIPVSGVAQLMISDAAQQINQQKTLSVFEMSELKSALKEGRAPNA